MKDYESDIYERRVEAELRIELVQGILMANLSDRSLDITAWSVAEKIVTELDKLIHASELKERRNV